MLDHVSLGVKDLERSRDSTTLPYAPSGWFAQSISRAAARTTAPWQGSWGWSSQLQRRWSCRPCGARIYASVRPTAKLCAPFTPRRWQQVEETTERPASVRSTTRTTMQLTFWTLTGTALHRGGMPCP
jgi:hypothetical protein